MDERKRLLLPRGQEETPDHTRRGKTTILLASCALVLLVVNGVFDFNGKTFIKHFMGQTMADIDYGISVLGRQDYAQLSDLNYPWVSEHLAVVEPFRTTTLVAAGAFATSSAHAAASLVLAD